MILFLILLLVSNLKTMVQKKYSVVEIALLSIAFRKSTQTIIRWIAADDDRLTSDKAKLTLTKLKKK